MGRCCSRIPIDRLGTYICSGLTARQTSNNYWWSCLVLAAHLYTPLLSLPFRQLKFGTGALSVGLFPSFVHSVTPGDAGNLGLNGAGGHLAGLGPGNRPGCSSHPVGGWQCPGHSLWELLKQLLRPGPSRADGSGGAAGAAAVPRWTPPGEGRRPDNRLVLAQDYNTIGEDVWWRGAAGRSASGSTSQARPSRIQVKCRCHASRSVTAGSLRHRSRAPPKSGAMGRGLHPNKGATLRWLFFS